MPTFVLLRTLLLSAPGNQRPWVFGRTPTARKMRRAEKEETRAGSFDQLFGKARQRNKSGVPLPRNPITALSSAARAANGQTTTLPTTPRNCRRVMPAPCPEDGIIALQT